MKTEADSREVPRRRPPGKVVVGLVGVVMTLAVAAGVMTMSDPGPVALAPTDQAADLRLEAAALIEQIEAFRAERGVLPDPNVLVPYLDEGYEYHVVSDEEGRYVVQRSAGGVTVTYDGSLPVSMWVLIGGATGGGP